MRQLPNENKEQAVPRTVADNKYSVSYNKCSIHPICENIMQTILPGVETVPELTVGVVAVLVSVAVVDHFPAELQVIRRLSILELFGSISSIPIVPSSNVTTKLLSPRLHVACTTEPTGIAPVAFRVNVSVPEVVNKGLGSMHI
jgi:hypothetical protein